MAVTNSGQICNQFDYYLLKTKHKPHDWMYIYVEALLDLG